MLKSKILKRIRTKKTTQSKKIEILFEYCHIGNIVEYIMNCDNKLVM